MTGLSYGLQILRKRGVEKPLVDEHLLYNSNMRDEGVIVASVGDTTSCQIFVKGRNGKSFVLWMKSLDMVDDIKRKIELKDGIPVKEQRLVFNGQEMLGEGSLSDYHVRKNNTLSW